MSMTLQEFEKQKQIFTQTVLCKEENPNSDLSVILCGFESADKNKEVIVPGINYCIHFIVQGSIQLKVDKKKTVISKGSIFLFSPFKSMSYKIVTDKIAKYYWLTLSGKEITNYLSKAGFDFDSMYVKIPIKLMNSIRKALFNCFSSDLDSYSQELTMMESFFKIIKTIHSYKHGNLIHTYNKAFNYVDETLAYINDNYSDPNLKLSDIAKKLFIHENYLSTLFNRTVGCSFKKYVNQKRANKAVMLIREGNLSINEVASMVGISDSSYFTKIFKKYNGITPSEEVNNYLKRNELIR